MRVLTDVMLNIPYAVAAKYARGNEDLREELVGIGNLALVKALQKFDPTKNHDGEDGIRPFLYQRVDLYVKREITHPRLNFQKWKKLRFFSDLENEETGFKLEGVYTQGFSDLENREFIEVALSRLDPIQQAIFRLYHGEGLTQDQIGQRLGISHTAVYSVLKRASRKVSDYVRHHSGKAPYNDMEKARATLREMWDEDKWREHLKKMNIGKTRYRKKLAIANMMSGNVPLWRTDCGAPLWYLVDHSAKSVDGPFKSLASLCSFCGVETPNIKDKTLLQKLPGMLGGLQPVKGKEARVLIKEQNYSPKPRRVI